MLLKLGLAFTVLCCAALTGYAQSIKVGNGPGSRAVIYYDSSLPGIKFDNDDDGDIEHWFSGSGNFRFNGALMPNNSTGNSGDILRSNGSSAPSWVNIQSLVWGTTGNAGTGSGNFLGTTDNQALAIRTNNVERARFYESTGDDDSGAFVPSEHNVYSLGSPTQRWKELYLGPSSLRIGGFANGAKGSQDPQTIQEAVISFENGALNIDQDVTTSGDLLPDGDGIYNIGASNNRWQDLYLSNNSLHIGSSASEATMSYDDDLQLLHFSIDGAGSPEVTIGGGNGSGLLGIGTTAVTSLDVNGDAAFRFSNLSLANGANTGVTVGASSMVRITGPTAAFDVHGLTGGVDGKIVELYNASGQTMRIHNQSATEATAANRIVTGTGHSFEVRNMCGVSLVYNTTDNRWLMTAQTRNTSTVSYSMKSYASFGTTSQNAFAPDYGYVCHRVSSSGNVSMSGINSTGVQDGTLIILVNTGSSNITIQNESGNAASAAYRIITGTGNNEALGPNKPATLVYDATSQRWRFLSGR